MYAKELRDAQLLARLMMIEIPLVLIKVIFDRIFMHTKNSRSRCINFLNEDKHLASYLDKTFSFVRRKDFN